MAGISPSQRKWETAWCPNPHSGRESVTVFLVSISMGCHRKRTQSWRARSEGHPERSDLQLMSGVYLEEPSPEATQTYFLTVGKRGPETARLLSGGR